MRTHDPADEAPSIWKASYEGSDMELAEMLAAGADPNEPALVPSREGGGSWVSRPLARAASSDRAGAVRLLVAAGARVDEPDADGLTPLMVAVWFGALGAARALLDGGADPNLRDPKGACALHYATTEGLVSEAMELLERGAAPSLAFENAQGCLPIDLALLRGREELAAAMASRMAETLGEEPLRSVAARWTSWLAGADLDRMERMGLAGAGDRGQAEALRRAKAALRPFDEAAEIDQAAGPGRGAGGGRL